MKKALLAAFAFAIGWVWGFLSLRALLERTRGAFRPSTIVKRAADEGESLVARLSGAVESGRERARQREAELRRRFGLEV